MRVLQHGRDDQGARHGRDDGCECYSMDAMMDVCSYARRVRGKRTPSLPHPNPQPQTLEPEPTPSNPNPELQTLKPATLNLKP